MIANPGSCLVAMCQFWSAAFWQLCLAVDVCPSTHSHCSRQNSPAELLVHDSQARNGLAEAWRVLVPAQSALHSIGTAVLRNRHEVQPGGARWQQWAVPSDSRGCPNILVANVGKVSPAEDCGIVIGHGKRWRFFSYRISICLQKKYANTCFACDYYSLELVCLFARPLLHSELIT